MFYGYPLDNWIGLLEYCIMMIVLFTGIFIFSSILANKMVCTNKRNKHKTITRKSYFIDVA